MAVGLRKQPRTAIFLAITPCIVVIPYGSYGTTCRSHLQRWRIQEELPLLAASEPRRAQLSATLQRSL